MTLAAFVFESLVALLLLGAVIMCLRVDRRLRALKTGQDGMMETVRRLDESTDRARASLAALDRAAREHGETLEGRVREARDLADELALLAERAEARAETIARGPERPRPAHPAPEARSEARSETRRDGRAERTAGEALKAGEGRLLDALKAMR